MHPDGNDDIVITYMYIKRGKWKTETKQTKKEDLQKYQNDKYRILNIVDLEDYYSELERK